MERTYIRIGNSGYEKLYGSYGLTTLKDKHVAVEGSLIKFCFKGKKGIDHEVTVRNKKLAKRSSHAETFQVKSCFNISMIRETGKASTREW